MALYPRDKDIYIIDIEGFEDNEGALIAKEIAIVSISGLYFDHWINEPPFWFFDLNSARRGACMWRTNTVHGLEWEQGEIPYSSLFDRLLKLGRGARRIFAYGQQKSTFLEKIMNVNVVNMEGTMPVRTELPYSPEFCIYHGIYKKERYTCALNTVMRMRRWMCTQTTMNFEDLPRTQGDGMHISSNTSETTQSASPIYDVPRTTSGYAPIIGQAQISSTENTTSLSSAKVSLEVSLASIPPPTEKPPPIPNTPRPGTPFPLKMLNKNWTSQSSATLDSGDYLSEDELVSILDCPPDLNNDGSEKHSLIKKAKNKITKKRMGWKLSKTFFALTTLFWASADAFVAYDCGSSSLNVTTVSLLDVGECDIPPVHVNVSKVHIQVLQLNEYSHTHVIQCKISIERTVYYCGMHSHVSVVAHGYGEYIKEIGQEECNLLHQTGILQIGHRSQIVGIRPNFTTSQPVTLAGKIEYNGKCTGTQYEDPIGEWDNVVVQGVVRIRLQDYYASVSLNTNKIHFMSGYTCTLSEGSCVELEGGYSFWPPLPTDRCDSTRYSVLYEGMANKLIDKENENLQLIYSLIDDDITFALSKKGQKLVCGYELVYTDHPQLFVLEGRQGNY